MMGAWECRAFDIVAKASVVGEGTGRRQPADSPGSQRAACRDRADSESTEPLVGRFLRSRIAKASRISRRAVKSRCACEWGGWGRVSVDGSGQNNPNRSEDPWGRAAEPLAWRCSIGQEDSDTGRKITSLPRGARKAEANQVVPRVCRARLNRGIAWEGTVRQASLSAVLGRTRRTE